MLQPHQRARAVLLCPFRGPIACADDYNTKTIEYERDASILDIKTELKKKYLVRTGLEPASLRMAQGQSQRPHRLCQGVIVVRGRGLIYLRNINIILINGKLD